MKWFHSFVICVLLAVLLFGTASAQVNIKGRVIDQVTKKPLVKASVILIGTDQSVVTNIEGKFTFYCEQCRKDRVKLMVSFVGYGRQTFTFDLTEPHELFISMRRIDFTLSEVIIVPEQLKYFFYGSNEAQVQDYIFVKDSFLIASYDFKVEKTFIDYLGKSKNSIFTHEFVNPLFRKFYVSCINKYYAEASDEVFEISFKKSKIKLDSVKFDYFEKTIKHYVGYSEPFFYITQFQANNLVQGFFTENTEQDKISEIPFAKVVRENDLTQRKILRETKIYQITDQPNKPNTKQDINSPASDPKNPTFDNPSYRPPQDEGYYSESTNEFGQRTFQTMFFKRDFAPFYLIDSTIVLINYYQNFIERHSINGRPIDTIALKIGNTGKRSIQTFLDEATKKIYYRKEDEDSTQIYELNILNGNGKKVKTVSRKEIFNIKIRNDFVYYLFNPPVTNNLFLFW
ncbi:MAG: carboxypeptidase-like regulatory domain-containing protein [Bacteroidia bacterium]